MSLRSEPFRETRCRTRKARRRTSPANANRRPLPAAEFSHSHLRRLPLRFAPSTTRHPEPGRTGAPRLGRLATRKSNPFRSAPRAERVSQRVLRGSFAARPQLGGAALVGAGLAGSCRAREGVGLAIGQELHHGVDRIRRRQHALVRLRVPRCLIRDTVHPNVAKSPASTHVKMRVLQINTDEQNDRRVGMKSASAASSSRPSGWRTDGGKASSSANGEILTLH